MEKTIAEFARLTGVTKDDLHLYQRKLYPEEAKEFWDGVQTGNIIEQRDGAADMLFIISMIELMGGQTEVYKWNLASCLAMSEVTPAQLDADLNAVIESNFTKFDKTEDEATKTRDHYQRVIGIQTHSITDEKTGLILTFSSKDQVGHPDSKFYPEGKLLKSVVNYRDPEIGVEEASK